MAMPDGAKLSALLQARTRAEAALAGNETWQSLRRVELKGAAPGEAARLAASLQSDPLYRAWSNMNAAIAALQAGASGPPPEPAAEPADPGTTADIDRVMARAFEEEASVTFVARTPRAPPRALPSPSDGAGLSASGSVAPPSATRGSAETATVETATVPVQPPLAGDADALAEAEVSLVSVEARRHAGAVLRVLRALSGKPDPQ